MEFKLDVYDGREVVKTFVADERDVTVGICEDVLRMVDVERLPMMGTDPAAAEAVTASFIRAFMQFREVAKRLFPDMTDEDYRRCLPADVGAVMMGLVTYSLQCLMGAAGPKAKGRGRTPRSTRSSSRRSAPSATASPR